MTKQEMELQNLRRRVEEQRKEIKRLTEKCASLEFDNIVLRDRIEGRK